MKRAPRKPVFKHCDQDQQMLLPPSLDELIDEKHPVRIVNEIIDKINLKLLYNLYQGGGAPSFDQKMMLKVIIYAYITNTYSSRKIEAALKENIHFMWLSGMSKPDHNTINRFRSGRLLSPIKDVFTALVMLLYEEGFLDIKKLFEDGTKIGADANKYTFVWSKAIKTKKEKIVSQLEELWKYAKEVTKQELMDTLPTSYEEITPEKVGETVTAINESLKGHK